VSNERKKLSGEKNSLKYIDFANKNRLLSPIHSIINQYIPSALRGLMVNMFCNLFFGGWQE
jgi:hypothetical protein